ncbi:MAG: flagellar basal body rod protein FlgB [Veillonellaceae bacterium]|nr:flagellar basal body rod protein FlgB [Veillonellaceae bacterium]
MFDRLFNSAPINVLEKALAGSSLRHKVISNNIANVNTPGYKRMEVSFESELAAAVSADTDASASTGGLTRTHPKHLLPTNSAPVSVSMRTVNDTSLRTDGNNVDIDAEMAAMTKNNIFYNTVAQRIGGYYTNIKSAIKGG